MTRSTLAFRSIKELLGVSLCPQLRSLKYLCDAGERIHGIYMGHVSPEAQELRRKLLRDGNVVLDVKVIPRAHSGQIAELMANGILKVKVTAAPERGKANDEVCAVLAKCLAVPKRNIEVIFGHTSPQKRIRAVR